MTVTSWDSTDYRVTLDTAGGTVTVSLLEYSTQYPHWTEYTADSPAPWVSALNEVSGLRLVLETGAIGAYAFAGCVTLTDMDSTLLKSVGAHAFDGCVALSCDLDLTGTTVNEYAFYGCSNLGRLKWEYNGALGGTNAFRGSGVISAEVVMPGNNGIGIGMFAYCPRLAEAVVHIVGVVVTGDHTGAFEGCTALGRVTVYMLGKSTGGTNYFSTGYNLFKGCSSLRYVEFVGEGGTSSEVLTDVFSGCTVLTSLELPYMSEMYHGLGAENLKVLTLRGEKPPTIGSSMRDYLTGLDEIRVPASALKTYKSATNWSTLGDILTPVYPAEVGEMHANTAKGEFTALTPALADRADSDALGRRISDTYVPREVFDAVVSSLLNRMLTTADVRAIVADYVTASGVVGGGSDVSESEPEGISEGTIWFDSSEGD